MEMYSDTDGSIYNHIVERLGEGTEGLPNDLTVGIFHGKVFLAGVIYSVIGKVAYMTIHADSPRWCTKANITTLFELPFDAFDIKIVKAAVSHKNKKANKFLWWLKLKEEAFLKYGRIDGTHDRIFSITKKEIETKWWYKKRIKT